MILCTCVRQALLRLYKQCSLAHSIKRIYTLWSGSLKNQTKVNTADAKVQIGLNCYHDWEKIPTERS